MCVQRNEPSLKLGGRKINPFVHHFNKELGKSLSIARLGGPVIPDRTLCKKEGEHIHFYLIKFLSAFVGYPESRNNLIKNKKDPFSSQIFLSPSKNPLSRRATPIFPARCGLYIRLGPLKIFPAEIMKLTRIGFISFFCLFTQ